MTFWFCLLRFKDHVQGNHPKYFLSEEEFVQLRLELSKSSLSGMVGEDGESNVPQEELPPGTEDLADPAKVRTSPPLLVRDKTDNIPLAGLAGAFLLSMIT